MRRPLTALTALGAAAHHGYELGAGVGLVFQPQMGLPGSLAFWSANLPALAWAAARAPERYDKPLAFAAGTGLGGMAVHFTIWPWTGSVTSGTIKPTVWLRRSARFRAAAFRT